MFFKSAYGRAHSELERYIGAGLEMGFITRPYPPEQLADHLLSMWTGLDLVRCRLAVDQKPYDDPATKSATVIEFMFGEEVEFSV